MLVHELLNERLNKSTYDIPSLYTKTITILKHDKNR